MKKKCMCMSILMILILIICGCGAEDITSNNNIMDKQYDYDQMMAEHIKMQDLYQVATSKDNVVYGGYVKNKKGVIVKENYIENKVEEIVIENIDEFISISVDNKENVYVLGWYENEYWIWKINANSSIEHSERTSIEESGYFSEVKNMFADSEGYIYIWYRMTVPCSEVYENGEVGIYTPVDRIYIKDANFRTICYDDVPDSYGNKLIGILWKNEKPYVFAKDVDGYYEQKIRNSEEEICLKVRTHLEIELDSCSYISRTSQGYLYILAGDVYEYIADSDENRIVYHLASAGIYEKDIIFVGSDENGIIIIDNYKNYSESELTTIVSGKTYKTSIQVAVITLDEYIRNVIADFNRNQNGIVIEPVIYANDFDYDGGIEKLKLDIIQGTAPDLFFTNGIDYETLIRVGAIDNLYSYMEYDDELNQYKIMDCINKAYSQEGSIYTLAPTFVIHTMWGSSMVIGDKNYKSIEELLNVIEEMGGDINSIYGLESADESVLHTLTTMELDQFINWEDSTCDFLCNEFYKLLEFSKEYEGPNNNGSLYLSIQNKDILFSYGVISSVEDYCIQKELYGGNIDITGYPTNMGFGSAVALINPIAINSSSKNKIAAWEFVKYYTLNGYENDMLGFPVCIEGFEKAMEQSLEGEWVQTEFGYEQVGVAYYYEKDIVDFIVYSADLNDVDAIKIVLRDTTKKYEYVVAVQNIIEEEAGAYFSNQKTVEEVAEIIQSRVSIFLAE